MADFGSYEGHRLLADSSKNLADATSKAFARLQQAMQEQKRLNLEKEKFAEAQAQYQSNLELQKKDIELREKDLHFRLGKEGYTKEGEFDKESPAGKKLEAEREYIESQTGVNEQRVVASKDDQKRLKDKDKRDKVIEGRQDKAYAEKQAENEFVGSLYTERNQAIGSLKDEMSTLSIDAFAVGLSSLDPFLDTSNMAELADPEKFTYSPETEQKVSGLSQNTRTQVNDIIRQFFSQYTSDEIKALLKENPGADKIFREYIITEGLTNAEKSMTTSDYLSTFGRDRNATIEDWDQGMAVASSTGSGSSLTFEPNDMDPTQEQMNKKSLIWKALQDNKNDDGGLILEMTKSGGFKVTDKDAGWLGFDKTYNIQFKEVNGKQVPFIIKKTGAAVDPAHALETFDFK